MGIKLMKPKIDFAFKEIMMDDEVMIFAIRTACRQALATCS